MELMITPRAIEKINDLSSEQPSILLWYDTEGCGCGVNGVPTFRIINDSLSTYKRISSNLLPVFVPEQHAVFFGKYMKLDFSAETFRLVSNEGILNPFISPANVVS
ncbi:iron-sulfur cluster biosynthesis family protein [Ornithinibacillus sp. L9]|uniref:Iron-sulfur cluster biosynthesis family protein n=1 Tax=Ornithinibacillus caprae TaxID=2678566 RepID=A0A6N8FG10_9BACI|nr:iron-sulfur cluster biosynthesis family protein [Ornithinibacillus caprae]MUK87204.1 iron-sulfur cluster biosynthesis family protein [Ornithinibacillus caprae]